MRARNFSLLPFWRVKREGAIKLNGRCKKDKSTRVDLFISIPDVILNEKGRTLNFEAR